MSKAQILVIEDDNIEKELPTTIEMALYEHELERKLKEKERWLATTLRSIGDAVITTDEKGLVTFMNPIAEALTGWKQEDALARDLIEVFNIVNEQTRTLAESPVKKALREGIVVGLANHSLLIARDGRETPVDDSAAPIRDDKGNITGVVLVFRDVTERKRTEEMLHTLNAAAAAIQRAARTPEAVFTAVMEQLRALGLTGAVALLDEERERFTIRYTTLASRALARAEKLVGLETVGYTFPVEQLPLGRQLLAGEAVFVPDVAALVAAIVPRPARPLMPQAMRLLKMARGVVAPLAVEGRIIGFLGVSADLMTAADTPAVTAFANQMAAALESAQLYQAEKRHATRLKAIGEVGRHISAILDLDDLLHQVVAILVERFSYYYANILLVDAPAGEIVVRASAGQTGRLFEGFRLKIEQQGITGWVAKTGQPLLVNDVTQEPRYCFVEELKDTCSELALPIMTKGQVIGVMDVQSVHKDAFDEEDLFTLQTLAEQIAVGIENAQLHAEIEQRASELGRLYAAAQDLATSLEPRVLLEQLARHITQALDATSGYILEVDTKQAIMTVLAEYWSPAAIPAERVPDLGRVYPLQDYPIAIKAYQTGEVIDYRADTPGLTELEYREMVDYGVKSILIVPIIAQGKLLGEAEIWESRWERVFTPAEKRLAQALAQHAAGVIENARLFEAEHQARQISDTLSEIARELNAAPDLNAALDLVLSCMERVIAFDSSSILLLENGQMSVAAVRGFEEPERVLDTHLCLDTALLNKEVVETRRPLIVASTSDDLRWVKSMAASGLTLDLANIHSWMGVPLLVQERVIGMLTADKEEPNFYRPEDAELALAFAGHAAVAIENARLYEAAQRELTERKRTEATLRQSEEKYRTLVDNIQDGVFIIQDAEIQFGNEAFARMAGYTVEEITGMDFRQLVAPEDLEMVADRYRRRQAGEDVPRECEFRMLHKDGKTRVFVNVTVGLVDYRGRVASMGTGKDITERKRAEEALKEKDKFIESMLQSSAVATFVIDSKHNVIYWNKACEDLTGIKSEDLMGANDHWKAFYDHRRPCVSDIIIDSKFDDMANLYKVYAKSVLIPDGLCAEGWYPNLGGKNRYIAFDAAPICDANGKTIAAIETLQDITERKHTEEALRHSLEETARGQRLLLALSQAAQAVQRAHTPDQVYRTIGEQVAGLGYHTVVLTLQAGGPGGRANAPSGHAPLDVARDRQDRPGGEARTDERTQLVLAYLSFESALVQAAEKLMGVSVQDVRVPLAPGSLVERIIAEGEAAFSDRTAEEVAKILPKPLRPLASRLAALLGLEQGIVAPLTVGGETLGVLAVSGVGLTEADVPAVSAFANQAAIAIQNARLYEREQQRVARYARLLELSRQLRLSLDLSETLNRICQTIVEDLGWQQVIFSLRDCETKTSRPVAMAGYDAETVARTLALPPTPFEELGILRDEFRISHSYYIDHQHRAAIADYPDELIVTVPAPELKPGGWHPDDILLVTIEGHEGILGFISPDNPVDGQRPTLEMVQELEVFADQAASAIENARLYETEQKRRHIADTLRQVAAVLSSTLDPKQVLDLILEHLAQVVPYDSASVMLVSAPSAGPELAPSLLSGQALNTVKGQAALRVVAGRGFPDIARTMQVAIPVTEDVLFQEMLRTRQPVTLTDAQEDERFQAAGETTFVRGWIGAPLVVKGKVIGVLTVDSRVPGVYGQEEAEMVAAVANQAAIAIENARLFGEARQRVTELEELQRISLHLTSLLDLSAVLDSITESALALVRATNCHIYLYDEASETFTFGSGLWQDGRRELTMKAPRRAGFTATVAREGQPIVIDDAARHPFFATPEAREWGLRAIAGFPLKRADRVLGVLTTTFTEPHTYSKEELRVLTLLADQTAIAIDNARLFGEAQRRLQEVTLLSRVIAHTVAAEDVPAALEAVCAELAGFFGVPQARFALLEPERTVAEVVAEYRAAGRPSALGARIPVADNPAMAYVLEHKVPLAVTDAQTDPRLAPVHELMRQQDITSILIVPIESRGEVVGTLGLDSLERRKFSGAEVALAQHVASQVGQALARLELLQEVRAHAERMERLASVSEALTLPLDEERTISAIGEGALALCGAGRAAVHVRNVDDTVSCPWAHGLPPAYVAEVAGRVGEMPGGRLLAEQAPVLIGDTARLPADAPLRELSRAAGYRAVALWPLIYEGRTMAAVGCYTEAPRTWSQAEQEVMQAFARQAAVALENSRLYESLRAANRELQAALQTQDEMIQNVSHELRTPLTTISGYVELLGEAGLGPLTAEQAQALEVMRRQARQLYFMVNRFLTLQTIDARALQKVEVKPGLLFSQAVETRQARAAAAGIRVDLEVSADVPQLEVDVDLMNQVLDNLLDNALKFSPDGGVVRVRVWTERSAASPERQVLISIVDPGIGIPPDKLEHVFERFYQADGSTTRRFGGAGIGLALCRKIVAAHGGRIWAESEGEGRGSTFYVALPGSASEPVIMRGHTVKT